MHAARLTANKLNVLCTIGHVAGILTYSYDNDTWQQATEPLHRDPPIVRCACKPKLVPCSREAGLLTLSDKHRRIESRMACVSPCG